MIHFKGGIMKKFKLFFFLGAMICTACERVDFGLYILVLGIFLKLTEDK